MVASPDRLVASTADLWATFGGLDHDAMAAQLASTDAEFAVLEARYGRDGTWDAERKAHRSLYELKLRDELMERGEKATEAKVEALAASHPEVTKWLNVALLQKVRYQQLRFEREAITQRMRHLTAVTFAGGRAPGY